MKISGFTILRNAQIMGYPFLESIKSLLPIVDEYIIGVGQSEDETVELLKSIKDPKIKIIPTTWSTAPSGGTILSEKTNEVLSKCSHDWCFYLQCDEVLHESDYSSLIQQMEKHEKNPDVEGLLFKYIHFYGSYDIVATNRKWYRQEVRIVKKSSGIQSWKDAQGFRVNGRKPKVKWSDGRIFHYGWVKPPKKMGEKKKHLDRLWHGNKKDVENDAFQFEKQYGLKKFTGTHPTIMKQRVQEQNWNFNYKRSLKDWKSKDIKFALSDLTEKVFNYRLGEYKNFELINK